MSSPYPKYSDLTRWYSDPTATNNLNNNTTTGYAQGQAFMYAIEVYDAGTIKAMGVYKTTGANRTALSVALAIYNCAADGSPGTVRTDFGVLSLANASTGINSVNGSCAVTPGTYYVAIKMENSGSGVATPSFLKRNAASRDATFPYGYSGTVTTDFTSTTTLTERLTPPGYTGLATGAWVDLTSTAPTVMPAFNFFPLYTFTATPSGGPYWGWGAASGAPPSWAIIS